MVGGSEKPAVPTGAATEITASYPCTYGPVGDGCNLDDAKPNIPIDESLMARLCKAVSLKQLHACFFVGGQPRDCRKDNPGRCKKGFPFTTPNRQGTHRTGNGSYDYFRFSKADKDIVVHHPGVLLVWDAHCNLQRVVNATWSQYVLKYALKIEKAAPLKLSAASAEAMGLHGLSEQQRALVASSVFARPMSTGEAVLWMSHIDLVQTSYTVRVPQ